MTFHQISPFILSFKQSLASPTIRQGFIYDSNGNVIPYSAPASIKNSTEKIPTSIFQQTNTIRKSDKLFSSLTIMSKDKPESTSIKVTSTQTMTFIANMVPYITVTNNDVTEVGEDLIFSDTEQRFYEYMICERFCICNSFESEINHLHYPKCGVFICAECLKINI